MKDEALENETRSESDIYTSKASDGLVNVISGLGTAKARDPASVLGRDATLDRVELEDIYRYYWISKAVDIKPWDMTREWRTFTGVDIDDKHIKAIEEEERRTELPKKARENLTWSSVYGGSAIVIHVNGHGNMQMPLDVTKIKKGQLNRFSAVDRWNLIEFGPIDYNPISATYGTAEFYTVANDTNFNKIHRSRIVFLRGRKMPVRVERQLKVWGDSDIQRWYKAITNSETLSSGIIEGVHQANVDVVAVKGLAQLLSQKDGEQKAIKRFMAMDYCKSLLNMSIIDSEDSFTRNAFPLTGLPEIYRVFLEVLSSATDIPITRLLGSSPGGLSATGEGDTRNYYDMIKSLQKAVLEPMLYQIDQVLVRSALGDYPESLEYEFNPLWQMTPNEEAELRVKNAGVLASLQALGVPEYTLMKDAIEMDLVKNMTIEDVEKMESDDEFDVEEGNEDFKPEEEVD